MDDAAYKQLFSRPRMVRDLLQGFAARGWSDGLDFASLTPLPAGFVSRDLRQRHGDAVWRVRFRDRRWLYLVLLLEFQSAVDQAMAVRMLTYTGLLYEKLIGEGALRDHGALPPVLPIVIYNGRRPWSAAVEVVDLIAAGEPDLARHQPSLRYFLLDEGRAERGDLPPGNLVSALIALEANRDRESLPVLLDELIVLLREQDDEELTNAFTAWARQALVPRRRRADVPESLPGLQEVRTMLAETVQEWAAPWIEKGREEGLEKGREEGLEKGRAEERALLCRQAEIKFDATTARRLAEALADVSDADRLAKVGDWIIKCRTPAEMFARLAGGEPRN